MTAKHVPSLLLYLYGIWAMIIVENGPFIRKCRATTISNADCVSPSVRRRGLDKESAQERPAMKQWILRVNNPSRTEPITSDQVQHSGPMDLTEQFMFSQT